MGPEDNEAEEIKQEEIEMEEINNQLEDLHYGEEIPRVHREWSDGA
jgi:hypothetical protein